MPRPSYLARTAGISCGDPTFRAFLADRYPDVWKDCSDLQEDAERAAAVVRCVCEIRSRSELDTDCGAAQRYHTRIGFRFNEWKRETAATA